MHQSHVLARFAPCVRPLTFIACLLLGQAESVRASGPTAAIIYVDADATGADDGSSWCDAYRNPQFALFAAAAGDTIRVADGTYMPDGGYISAGGTSFLVNAGRTPTFTLVDGVALEGGYAGCGAVDPDERDVGAFGTILSGDVAGNDAAVACVQDSDCLANGTLCSDSGFCIIADFNAENSYHVVTTDNSSTSAVLDGFTITAGKSNTGTSGGRGAGMYNGDFSSPTVANCTFTGNFASLGGGGMYNDWNSSPAVTNCTFRGNRANVGGGMQSILSDPAVTDCTFTGNSADGGAGMAIWNSSGATVTNCMFSGNSAGSGGGMEISSASPAVTGCSFIANSASYDGGGMFNPGSSPTVTNCTFSGNSADSEGGGMFNNESSSAVTNSTFSGNSAGEDGGGIYTRQNSSLVVTNCMFTGNSAGSNGGGMMDFLNTSATVTNCTFRGNLAISGNGGGMYNTGPDSAVTNCAFSTNSAGSNGGGMYNDDSSPAVTNCTFSGNSADGDGGGMQNFDNSDPTVTNCTFTGNSANDGGGMHNRNFSHAAVTNCTFSGNSANDGGGGIYNRSSSPAVTNCVFWGNVDDADGSSGGPFMDQSAQIQTLDGNPRVNYSIVQGGWNASGGIGVADSDPFFVDPDGSDNVPGTEDDNLRLMPGSPAIDAGRNDDVPPDVADLDGDGDTVEPMPLDLDGNGRFVDMPGSLDCPHGGACGTPPIVDMGPYETHVTGEPGRFYVDHNATGPEHDGFSWCTAYLSLSDPLGIAAPGSTIAVADGIYVPDATGLGNPRTATFGLRNNITIEGGYAGCGAADPDERDILFYKTVLSGDLAGDDAIGGSAAENAYHVVTAIGVDETAVLNGVEITAGNANGPVDPTENHGGGMILQNASPSVEDCNFVDNTGFAGGAVFMNPGSPTFTRCMFASNSAEWAGGIDQWSGSNSVFADCTFDGNSATNAGGGLTVNNGSASLEGCDFVSNTVGGGGGALWLLGVANVSLDQCTFDQNSTSGNGSGGGAIVGGGTLTVSGGSFTDNSAGGWGGAIALSGATLNIDAVRFESNTAIASNGGAIDVFDVDVSITNCAFGRNSAQNGGGMNIQQGNPVVTNCTFSANMANADGGGINNSSGSPSLTNCTFNANTANNNGGGMFNGNTSSPAVANCIFWGDSPNEVFNSDPNVDNPTVRYSNLQGGLPAGTIDGGGNIGADPLFVDAGGPDGTPGTIDDNLGIAQNSPAIDAGDNSASGLIGVTTDIAGAPRFLDVSGVADTGLGTPPIADMGAYEARSDCNDNGIPDDADIAGGTSDDCNANGVPDECEPDCNDNGAADACEILADPSLDSDANGILDECECVPPCEPIPTVSEWGVVVMTLLMLVAGTIVCGLRVKQQPTT